MLSNTYFKCGLKISMHIFRVGRDVKEQNRNSSSKKIEGLNWTCLLTSAREGLPGLVFYGLVPALGVTKVTRAPS